MRESDALQARQDDPQSGFTLIETLAAFTILALLLGVAFAGMARMLSGGQYALIQREGLRLARGKLDSIGISEPIVAGERVGSFEGGFGWRERVVLSSSQGRAPIVGAWVEVEVFPPGQSPQASSSAVKLTTYKLLPTARP